MNTGKEINRLGYKFYETRREDVFNELYNVLYPYSLSFLSRHFSALEIEIVEDAVTDAMILIWNKIEKYNPNYSFYGWSYKIAYHNCLMSLRRKNKEQVIEYFFEYADNIIADDAGDLERKEWVEYKWAKLHTVLDYLDDWERTLFEEKLIKKIKYDVLSQKYCMNVNTIKTHVKRIKRKVLEIDKKFKLSEYTPEVKKLDVHTYEVIM